VGQGARVVSAGDLLAYGNTNLSGAPVLTLWNIAAGCEFAQLQHSNVVAGVSFSPDQELLAALTSDGILTLWEVAPRNIRTNVRWERLSLPNLNGLAWSRSPRTVVGWLSAIRKPFGCAS
jgi:WD40 repeat protein